MELTVWAWRSPPNGSPSRISKPGRLARRPGAPAGVVTVRSRWLVVSLLVAFHDALRRDPGHLARTASRRPAELDDPARHTAEDHDLWPRMRTHLANQPDELALLQAMQDEHARIDPLLDAVEGAFADRDGGHQRLGDTVDALASALYGHLGHEERDALPLIDQSLTQAEWQAFGNDQRRLIGTGGAQLFPWLLDEASAEQIQAVLGGLPAPLRVVYRRIWQPRYARHDHWEPSPPA